MFVQGGGVKNILMFIILLSGLYSCVSMRDRSAVFEAIRKNDPAFIHKWIAQGGSLDFIYKGDTPLIKALKMGHKELILLLLSNKVDLDLDKDNSHPVFQAISLQDSQILSSVIQHTKNKDIRNISGENPVCYAIQSDAEEMVIILVNAGFSLVDDRTPEVSYRYICKSGDDSLKEVLFQMMRQEKAIPAPGVFIKNMLEYKRDIWLARFLDEFSVDPVGFEREIQDLALEKDNPELFIQTTDTMTYTEQEKIAFLEKLVYDNKTFAVKILLQGGASQELRENLYTLARSPEMETLLLGKTSSDYGLPIHALHAVSPLYTDDPRVWIYTANIDTDHQNFGIQNLKDTPISVEFKMDVFTSEGQAPPVRGGTIEIEPYEFWRSSKSSGLVSSIMKSIKANKRNPEMKAIRMSGAEYHILTTQTRFTMCVTVDFSPLEYKTLDTGALVGLYSYQYGGEYSGGEAYSFVYRLSALTQPLAQLVLTYPDERWELRQEGGYSPGSQTKRFNFVSTLSDINYTGSIRPVYDSDPYPDEAEEYKGGYLLAAELKNINNAVLIDSTAYIPDSTNYYPQVYCNEDNFMKFFSQMSAFYNLKMPKTGNLIYDIKVSSTLKKSPEFDKSNLIDGLLDYRNKWISGIKGETATISFRVPPSTYIENVLLYQQALGLWPSSIDDTRMKSIFYKAYGQGKLLYSGQVRTDNYIVTLPIGRKIDSVELKCVPRGNDYIRVHEIVLETPSLSVAR